MLKKINIVGLERENMKEYVSKKIEKIIDIIDDFSTANPSGEEGELFLTFEPNENIQTLINIKLFFSYNMEYYEENKSQTFLGYLDYVKNNYSALSDEPTLRQYFNISGLRSFPSDFWDLSITEPFISTEPFKTSLGYYLLMVNISFPVAIIEIEDYFSFMNNLYKQTKWYHPLYYRGDRSILYKSRDCTRNPNLTPKEKPQNTTNNIQRINTTTTLKKEGAKPLSNLKPQSSNTTVSNHIEGLPPNDISIQNIANKAIHGDKNSQFKLGQLFFLGTKGVKENHKNGLYWLTQSANQGHSESMFEIGRKYESGIGVEKNYNTALSYYKNAFNNGYEKAKVSINRLDKKISEQKQTEAKEKEEQLKRYRIIEKNQKNISHNWTLQETIRYCNEGNPEAQYKIGIYYCLGIKGFKEDYQKGIQFLNASAQKGYPDAYYELGRKYESGTGVPKDNAKALFYYQKALSLGYENAASSINRLSSKVK